MIPSGPLVPLIEGWCVHHAFEDQVRRTPDAIAVCDEKEQLTYRELNERADQLANYLRGLGVGPETLVGVFLERTASMLVALLGTLKAGGAYVPLDPIYPAERVAFVLEDAGTPVLLTQQELLNELKPMSARLVCLDRDWPEIAGEKTDHPIVNVRSNQLAYVMYTSGSTGKPKGVQIEHKPLINFLLSMRREPGLNAQDVLLAVTTLSFDIAGLEMFLPLICGARVIIVPWQTTADGEALIRTVENHKVSAMQATPATWRLMVEAGWQGSPNLKVLCGGEALSKDLARELLPRCRELWNMYGPTETTIWSTCCKVTDPDDIHIGWPLNNTDLYILDDQLKLLPIGEPGELLIGGEGLARGYLNRPELTAEKFIPHPFKPGERLYRTSDLARYRTDGAVDCLGRLDFQVKIRGYRIELGEIEALLRQHPQVKDAVVIAREDEPGDKRLVAYLVARDGSSPDPALLRELLHAQLPDYMIPAAFVMIESIPRTPNGKTDRKALPKPQAPRMPATTPQVTSATPLEQTLIALWKEVLKVDHVGLNDNFFDLGGHSLLVARVHAKLRTLLDRNISIVELYQYPTISALAAHLAPRRRESNSGSRAAKVKSLVPHEEESIAIVGMSGRFPGAGNLEEFWKNLRDGVESVAFFSKEELRASGVPKELIDDPAYVPAKAIVDKIDHFDARFFGYSPAEATSIDPQQRIFLEAAWEALEDAGYNPEEYAGSIGVYAGASPNLYMFQVLARHERGPMGYGFPLTVHQEKDYLATRVSYEFNLKGPSVSIQTACSTSLVAVHMACRSLLGGECDMALAGAVSAEMPQNSGYLHQEGGILSRDGHCRVFDAEASGTVFGNGVGIVVLKRLSGALRDRDTIRAIIKGTAINNDGSGKMGFTAPSVDGQAEVIEMAHRAAGVSADKISLVEAHGTGTVVGDPIEIAALSQAFRATTDQTGFCAVGSVKSNIGHLDAAAGMAGLIKTVLALEHRQIPPSLHFRTPNPNIDFTSSPFYVNTQLADWKADGPRRAGVSSFGVGGTNSHVILEEAPDYTAPQTATSQQVLLFSARTPTALKQTLSSFSDHLRRNPGVDIADLAYTLQVGRRAFGYRSALVCEDRDEVLKRLETIGPPALVDGDHVPKFVFMFTGQGSQYFGMGSGLYREEPLFASIVDECLEAIRPHLDVDLRGVLLAGSDTAALPDINQTSLAQPSLFIIEYALARLWMSWGIEPHAMMGHSIGEYVAACLAGVLSLPDALKLVARRGRLMQGLPSGTMLAVQASRDEVEELIQRAACDGRISLAAVNAPGSSVVSGPTDLIEEFEASLAANGLAVRRLHTSHAFHSSMMDPILQEFISAFEGVSLRPPRIPYVSNLTGAWLTDAEATNAAYYANHLRHAVHFSEGITVLKSELDPVFLEVGPGQTLTTLVKRHNLEGQKSAAFHSLPAAADKQADIRVMLNTLGQLLCEGARANWNGFNQGRTRRRIPLPTYPFERQRYSVEGTGTGPESSLLKRPKGRQSIDDWYYLPGWKSSVLAQNTLITPEEGRRTGVVFRSDDPFHEKVVRQLRQQGYDVVEVLAADNFRRAGPASFEINPGNPEQYGLLIDELDRIGKSPDLIVHLWLLGSEVLIPAGTGAEDWALNRGFFPLMFLAQAIAKADGGKPVNIKVIIDGGNEVMGERVRHPEKATLMGPCIVIPQELSHFTCSCIDVDTGSGHLEQEQRLLAQLACEFMGRNDEPLVAYRGGRRWTRTYDAHPLEGSVSTPPILKEHGVYLITGGLGGIGLEIAEYLAQAVQARLILVGRTSFPPRHEWPAWLAEHEDSDPNSSRIAKLQRIESLGAEVFICSADVSERSQMQAVIQAATAHFGKIDGIIHAAGIAGGGAIHLKTREAATAVLRAKVHGTRILGEIFAELHPDFMVLCSSVNAVVGGFGQVDYCAANAFLDTFAAAYQAQTGIRTLSVNWDTWANVGMAANTDVPEHLRKKRALELQEGISPAEGQDVFARVLSSGLSQVLVSTREFEEMRSSRQATGYDRTESQEDSQETGIPLHERPDLQSAYVAPQTDVEKTIATLWQQSLGIDRIGLHDNFFELGGDSLLAVQVVDRVCQATNTSLPVVTFYEAPTVALLAQRLQARNGEREAIEAPDTRRLARKALAQRGQRRRAISLSEE
jgi:amino acid adenylation domain-containing protein